MNSRLVGVMALGILLAAPVTPATAQQVRVGVSTRIGDARVGFRYTSGHLRGYYYDRFYRDARGRFRSARNQWYRRVRDRAHGRHHRRADRAHHALHEDLIIEHDILHRDMELGLIDRREHRAWHEAAEIDHDEFHYDADHEHHHWHADEGRGRGRRGGRGLHPVP